MLRRTWAVLCLTLAVVWGDNVEFAADSPVILVTQDSFLSDVLETRAISVVFFYSENTCNKCDVIVAEVDKAAKELTKYGMKVRAVEVDQNPKLKKQAALPGVPVVRVYSGNPRPNPYNKKTPIREAHDLYDSWTARAIQNHALKRLESSLVRRCESQEEYDQALSDAQTDDVAVLFTQKSRTSPLMKSLAYEFLGKVTFLEVPKDTGKLAEESGLEVPFLLALHRQRGWDQGSEYKGSLKNREEIAAFLKAEANITEDLLAATVAPPEAETAPNTKGDGLPDQAGAANILGPAEFLTEDSFRKYVERGKEAWVVGFVSKQEQAAEEVPGWETLAKGMDGQVRAGLVDCSAEPSLCGKEGRGGGRAPPYITVYAHELSDDIDRMEGTRFKASELKQALQAAEETLPELLVHLPAGLGDQEQAMAVDQWMQRVGMDLPEGGFFLLLGSKRSTPPLAAKSIAVEFADLLKVLFISSPSETTIDRMKFSRLPAAALLDPNPPRADDAAARAAAKREESLMSVTNYDARAYGPIKYNSLEAFVLHYLMQHHPERFRKLTTERARRLGINTPGDEKAAPPPEAVEVTTESWDSMCASGSSALCVVAFLDRQAEEFQRQLTTLQEGAGDAALPSASFLWVDPLCHGEFAETFNVQELDLPALVVYSPRRQLYARYNRRFRREELRDFLQEVSDGTAPTTQVYQMGELEDRDCSTFERPAPEAAPLEEEGLDDLMEEIRAEEARAKRALQEELAREAEERATGEAAATKKKKRKKKKKAGSSNEL